MQSVWQCDALNFDSFCVNVAVSSSTSSSSSGLFGCLFFVFAAFEQHSGKCCNFALFTLCFIFNLFYGRLAVSAPTLRV